MTGKSWTALWILLVLALLLAGALGAGSWLWHLLLRMHGVK
jgi:hypothetical protein